MVYRFVSLARRSVPEPAVGLFSPMHHGCCSYYLNSRPLSSLLILQRPVSIQSVACLLPLRSVARRTFFFISKRQPTRLLGLPSGEGAPQPLGIGCKTHGYRTDLRLPEAIVRSLIERAVMYQSMIHPKLLVAEYSKNSGKFLR